MKTLLTRFKVVGSAVLFTLNLSAQTTLPTPPPERNGQLTVSAGKNHSLAIGEGNVLWAWGSNSFGELGINLNTTTSLSPTQVVGGGVWSVVSAGEDHSLAIRRDGSLWVWGNNDEGQLGDGSLILRRSPLRLGTDSTWVAVAAGSKFSLALKSDGRLYAWGKNSDGQLGFKSLSEPKRNLTPRLVVNSNGITTPLFSGISAGSSYVLALGPKGTSGSSLFGWGGNAVNQLGLGASGQLDANGVILDSDPSIPGVQLPLNVFSPLKIGANSNWMAVSAGQLHALALTQSGSVYSWGLDILGSLGRTGVSSFPGLVSGISTATNVSAGGNHSLALSAGKLWGWGSNADRQLGFPLSNEYGTFLVENISRSVPTLLSSSIWERFSAGSAHSLLFGTTSSLGFGKNEFGQLGNGTILSPDGLALSAVKFGLPDLVATSVTILNSDVGALLPGDTLSLRVTLKNFGTSGIEPGFAFFQARLSSDDIFDTSDPLLEPLLPPTSFTSRLSGGGEVVQDFAFKVPSSLTSNTYKILLRVDDNSSVIESDELNNDFVGTESLRFLPNLTVLPQPVSGQWKLVAGIQPTALLSRTILAGDLATALNSLNSGTGPFGSLVTVSPLGQGHFLIKFSSLGNQPALGGDFAALSPAFGQVKTVIEGSALENEVQEVYLSNSPIEILTSTTVSRGSSFSAKVSLFNTGATPFVAASLENPVKVKLSMTLDSQIGNNDDVELATFKVTSDLAGQGGVVIFSTGSIAIPRYVNPGLYRLAFQVDPESLLGESIEGDNSIYLPSAFLNITPDASTVDLQESLDITFKNTSGAVIPSLPFVFAESGERRWFGESSVGAVGGDQALVPPLTAGETASISITLSGPFKVSFSWQLDSLSDILKFTVDGVAPTRSNSPSILTGQQTKNTFEATVGSSNLPRILTWTYQRTGSNDLEVRQAILDSITFTPLEQPDLLISQLSFDSKKTKTFILQNIDTPLDVVVLGGNFGKSMASGLNGGDSFDVEVRLSKDKIWGNTDDVILGKLEPIQKLDASNRYVYSQMFDLVNCIPEGDYFVASKVDSGSSYLEFDESNNIQFSDASITIEARPYLQVKSHKISFQPGMYTRRQLFPVEFEIVNSGCKDIAPGDFVNYDISLYGGSLATEATGALKITLVSLLERLLVTAQDSSGLKAGSSIRFVQSYRIPYYMEKNVIEGFSTYKPLDGEILGQFGDFDITAKEANPLAANAYLTGNSVYTIPYAGYPDSAVSPAPVTSADLPDYRERGPILFGVKVALSSNVPLVKTETLFSRLSVGVVATRPESVGYDYFRKFWSLRWNQMDSDGLSSLTTIPPLTPAYAVVGVGFNPYGFDVGVGAADPDSDGFSNAQEFVFGSNPWISNRNSGQTNAPVTLGLIETGGVTDTSGQVILPSTKYMTATFNISMQHAFGGLSDTTPFSASVLSGLIGKAPIDSYVSNNYLTYIVEAGSKADFSDAVEVFRVSPKSSLNVIEGDTVRLLPHAFNPSVVGVTNNGSTARVTLIDKDSVDGFSTRFMRVRVIDTSP